MMYAHTYIYIYIIEISKHLFMRQTQYHKQLYHLVMVQTEPIIVDNLCTKVGLGLQQ